MQPFVVNIAPAIIDDLKIRLASTRWPDEIRNSGWDYGTNKGYLEELCFYWQNEFDWDKQQKYLNSFQHFTATVDDFPLHFIYEKGEGDNCVPLLLTHGYPDSFVRFLKVIPLLTKADKDGFAFDIIIPSIPGFGFSGIPEEPGMNPEKVATLFYGLMKQLGYTKYFAQGGDWGSSITEQLAVKYTDHLLGIHLTDVPFHHLFKLPEGELTKAEQQYLAEGKQWQMTEGGYAIQQSTKPQTLSYGLNDSPAGLASWIIEKFQRWSDCDGDPDNCFTKDDLLINLTIYWATQTINSANRIYYETKKKPLTNSGTKNNVPAAVALFPKDLTLAPRDYAERFFNIKRWTEMPKGGHFSAWEQPDLFAADVRAFGKTIPTNS